MNTSQKGIDMIKGFEELSLNSYQKSNGDWAIGYGTTRYALGKIVLPNESITEQVAEILLLQRLNDIDSLMLRIVMVPLTQNQWDATADFIYNLGDCTFALSAYLGILNTGDYWPPCRIFSPWMILPCTQQNKSLLSF